jgi:hypothetical protein
MFINVTQEHINNGTKGSPVNCALALALKEIFQNKSLDVSVFTTSLVLNRKVYAMPKNGTDFIRMFDSDIIPCKPMELNIPELSLV